LYHLIKGHFQERLEQMLPPEIKVDVLRPDDDPAGPEPEPRAGMEVNGGSPSVAGNAAEKRPENAN
jgi:hypothetical protein